MLKILSLCYDTCREQLLVRKLTDFIVSAYREHNRKIRVKMCSIIVILEISTYETNFRKTTKIYY